MTTTTQNDYIAQARADVAEAEEAYAAALAASPVNDGNVASLAAVIRALSVLNTAKEELRTLLA